jgi:AAA domain
VVVADVEDFRFCDNWGFNLANEAHRGVLEGAIAKSEPALVILDPLYLMLGGVNYDRHDELQPYLKWLKDIRYRYGCGVICVHHYGKQKEFGAKKGGQRMLGSMTLHAWSDSAVYLSRLDEDRGSITRSSLSTEFRSQAPTDDRELAVSWGKSFTDFEVTMNRWDLEGQLRATFSDGMYVKDAALAMFGTTDKEAKSRVMAIARGAGMEVKNTGKKAFGHDVYRLWNGK